MAPGELKQAYSEGRFAELPEELGAAMEEAKAVLARTGNPQLADMILDKAYFSELKKAARSAESSFLEGYAEILVDSANLKSAVRILRMGKGEEFSAPCLCPAAA